MWHNTFPHFLLCSKSKIKEKEKKRNINNDLAILPSYDTNYSKNWKAKSSWELHCKHNKRKLRLEDIIRYKVVEGLEKIGKEIR